MIDGVTIFLRQRVSDFAGMKSCILPEYASIGVSRLSFPCSPIGVYRLFRRWCAVRQSSKATMPVMSFASEEAKLPPRLWFCAGATAQLYDQHQIIGTMCVPETADVELAFLPNRANTRKKNLCLD